MESLLGVLCVLGVVLSLVTLVGHGLWVAAAGLLRTITGVPDPRGHNLPDRSLRGSPARGDGPRETATAGPGNCPSCGTRLAGGVRQCAACGWGAEVKPLPPLRSLTALVGQVERLHQAGSIDDLSFERLNDALQTELSRVRTQIETAAQAQREAARAAADKIESSSIFEIVEEPVVPVRQAAPEPRPKPRPAAPPAPPVPAEPTRSWSQVLDGFMEERNLRWGELIGGMLIVCGSIALVISFWSQIAERPFLKFFVFNGFTAAMFGAAVYCDRRLRLPTTSRGLYSIATLLVPLNFLALAAFSRDTSGDNIVMIGGELVSIGLFTWLTWLSGRTMAPQGAGLLSAGIMLPSIANLLVRRFVHSGAALSTVYPLAALPVVSYLVATGWPLWRQWTERPGVAAADSQDAHRDTGEPTEVTVHGLFRLLGVTTFATLLPLALLTQRTGDVAGTIRWLSPLVSLAAGPALAVGLLVWQRVVTPARAGQRTAGSAVALAGVLVLLAGIACAWPHPLLVLVVALVDFGLLTALAYSQSLPAAHLLALPCLGLAYLVGVHVVRGDLNWGNPDSAAMTRALLSASTGTALLPLAVLFGGAAARLARTHADHARFQALVAALAGGLSLALVTCFGLGRYGDPGGATWVYGCYALALWVVAFGGERLSLQTAGSAPLTESAAPGTADDARRVPAWLIPTAAWAGAGLLLVAFVQGAVFGVGHHFGWRHPWPAALLGHASVLALAVGLQTWWSRRQANPSAGDVSSRATVHVAGASALTTSIAAAICLGGLVPQVHAAWIAERALWVSGVWGVLAWCRQSARQFSLFQGGLTAALVFGVAGWIETQPWGATRHNVWLDPWSWQIQGCALCLVGLGWQLLRHVLRSAAEATVASRLRSLVTPAWPATDRVVGWALLGLFLTMAIYGAVPGVAQELAPRSLAAELEQSRGVVVPPTGRVVPALSHFEYQGIPHQHALGWGAWLWLAGVAGLFATWIRERRRVAWRAGLLMALSGACPLVAGLWEGDIAAASALRWTSALFLALSSVAIWFRESSLPEHERDRSGWMTALVMIVSAAPLAAMGLFVSTAAVSRFPLERSLLTTLGAVIGLCILAVPLGAGLWIVSSRWLASLPTETVLATAEARRRNSGHLRHASLLIWILGAGPLVVVGLFIVSAALRGNPIVGPEPGTLFQRLGLAASYATPVAICALTLVGYAVRERSSGFSFAAGLLFNVSATAAYLLLAAKDGLRLDAVLSIRLAQLNAIVSSVYGMCWMATARLAESRRHESAAIAASAAGEPLRRIAGMPIPGLLVTQSLLGVALLVAVQVPCFLALFVREHGFPELAELAEPLGRTAWFLTVAGVFVLGRLAGTRPAPGVVATALCSLGLLAAAYASRWENGNDVVYRTWLVAASLAGWCLLLGFAGLDSTVADEPARQRSLLRWTTCLGLLVVCLAWRHAGRPDTAPVAVAAIVSQAVLAALVACWIKRRGPLYVTGVLASIAQLLWWSRNLRHGPSLEPDGPILFLSHVRAWLLPALVSFGVERWLIAPAELSVERSADSSRSFLEVAFHRTAALVALVCLAVVAIGGLLFDAASQPLTIPADLLWQALACALVTIGLCAWDPRSVAPSCGVYLWGLATGALVLHQAHAPPRMIVWHGVWILAGYGVLTAALWRVRNQLAGLALRLQMPPTGTGRRPVLAWLRPLTWVVTVAVLAGAFAVVLNFAARNDRLISGTCALFPSLALGLLARRTESGAEGATHADGRRLVPEDCLTSLVVGVVGLVAWSWAWQEPGAADLLQRFVVMTAALAAATSLCGLGLVKLLSAENTWAQAGQRLTPVLCLATLGAVLGVVGNEVTEFAARGVVSLSGAAIGVVALTILGLCAAALTAALVPGRDPLGLSERGRTLYVYATEVLLAVQFLHVRLTMPWLFHGFFLRYWPFVVMGLAFLGVGVAEVFRRQQRLVLADPLERTGALLPVVPVLAFWALPEQGHFSLVLLAAGAVYTTLSVLRKSFGFGVLAALAANGGLWYFLHKIEGYGFLQHPQLWMIPLALCLLGAGYLNQERLSGQQQGTLRYLASTIIYLSSTADMFLNGLNQAPWLPVVLAGLAIAGIFAGILLRVRAFLFLGTGFLALAMLAIIWHAAVDLQHTWLIWLTVVLAGIVVLAVFAVFEKKRQEILQVVDKVRQWSP